MSEKEFKQMMWDTYVQPHWDDVFYYKKLERDRTARYNRRVAVVSNVLAFLAVICLFPFILLYVWWKKFVRFFKTEF